MTRKTPSTPELASLLMFLRRQAEIAADHDVARFIEIRELLEDLGDSRIVDRSVLVSCDSYISLCRYRHWNPPDVQSEMDVVIRYLRASTS
jgi:hypothetical protein